MSFMSLSESVLRLMKGGALYEESIEERTSSKPRTSSNVSDGRTPSTVSSDDHEADESDSRQECSLCEDSTSSEADSAEAAFAAVLRWDGESGAWVPDEIEITDAPPLPPFAAPLFPLAPGPSSPDKQAEQHELVDRCKQCEDQQYKKHISEAIWQGKDSIEWSEHVEDVQVSEDPSGWTIVIRAKGCKADPLQHELVQTAAKEALFDAAACSKCVYLIGFCSPKPFEIRPYGFEAKLGVMKVAQAACWHIFKKGFCRHGADCSKQHPVYEVPVHVVIESGHSKRKAWRAAEVFSLHGALSEEWREEWSSWDDSWDDWSTPTQETRWPIQALSGAAKPFTPMLGGAAELPRTRLTSQAKSFVPFQ